MAKNEKGQFMAKTEGVISDLFMQFQPFEIKTSDFDAGNLVEVDIATGLSIRAPRMWRIHKIEVDWPISNLMLIPDEHALQLTIGSRIGAAARPQLNDAGVLKEFTLALGHGAAGTEGGFVIQSREDVDFLPPIAWASPWLAIYCRGTPDLSTLRDLPIRGRIGFTSQPIESQDYAELAETWEKA